jgi:hypothetical protein
LRSAPGHPRPRVWAWGVGLAAGAALLTLWPAPAQAIAVVWDSSSTPYPGLRVRRGHSVGPTHYFRAAFVSLCDDYVHVTATHPPSVRRTAGAWGAAAGVQLAANGDFFEYVSPPKVQGDAVGGGIHWPSAQTGVSAQGEWYYHHYGWIAFGPGWVQFTHTKWTKDHADAYEAHGYTVQQGWQPGAFTTQIPPGTQALVSGFPELVIEGKVKSCPDPAGSVCFPDRSDMQSGHRRTAMGLSADRQTFILVVTESTAVTGATLAAIMAQIGAWEAFNLDGGGSSQMWLEGQGYLVSSSDSPDRPVTNHWGVFAGAGSGMPIHPGACNPCVPEPEICDGIDNDCDGIADEGVCDLATLHEASGLGDWPACSARDVSITMQNVGGTSWAAADDVGLRFVSGPFSAPDFLPVGATVDPGGLADFAFTAVANAGDGSGTGQWTMARGDQDFDEPVALPVTITPPAFRSELADSSYAGALHAGERARVWAAFRNNGSGTWAANEVVLGTVPAERESTLWADSWLAFDVPARFEHDVPPGGLGELTFEVVMTEAADSVVESFGLRDPSGQIFGCQAGGLDLEIELQHGGAGAPMASDDLGSPGEDAGCGCRAAGAEPRPSAWSLGGLGLLLARALRRSGRGRRGGSRGRWSQRRDRRDERRDGRDERRSRR